MFNRVRVTIVAVTAAVCLLAQACTHSAPLHLVCLIDMSASVEMGAQASQFEALEPLFKQLQRGDSITIIPITGDALIEGQGNILRFQLSIRREAYDADLRRLRKEVQGKLRLLKEAGEQNPYKRTDILGAVELCAEEITLAPPDAGKTVVILSDFIQDDRQFNFTREPRLAASNESAEFAKHLARSRGIHFQDTFVYLGFLRSADLKGMPEARRGALRTFWVEYLKARGALDVTAATDGTGQVARFMERFRTGQKDRRPGMSRIFAD